jgi:hypothetical protein
VAMAEFYGYRLQHRDIGGITLLWVTNWGSNTLWMLMWLSNKTT